MRSGKRSQQEHIRILLEREKEIKGDYLSLLPKEFFENSVDGRRIRRGLRNVVYEFSDAATNLGKAFRNANPSLDLSRADEMRDNLSHNYPLTTDEEVWAFALEEVPRIARRIRRAKVPNET